MQTNKTCEWRGSVVVQSDRAPWLTLFFVIFVSFHCFSLFFAARSQGISDEDAAGQEGLLLWARKKTAGYRDVDPPSIMNFTSNWKNGMAFYALIHKHQPHLLDYDSLDTNNAEANLELAFSVAEGLGIPRLLDAEDVNVEKPDERSIMTQVSEYFVRFAARLKHSCTHRHAAEMNLEARGSWGDRGRGAVAGRSEPGGPRNGVGRFFICQHRQLAIITDLLPSPGCHLFMFCCCFCFHFDCVQRT